MVWMLISYVFRKALVIFLFFSDEAAGFCYVQDIALCILELLTKFTRVMYIGKQLFGSSEECN
jgi:hypothetical protein